jgi:two-component system, cell cycle sensor histidine kinase and response regulator CckA
MAKKTLEGLGYTVIESSNGIEALSKIEEVGNLNIDCLVTDMIMPEMGGRKLAEILLEKHPSLKVLFISGYMEESISYDGVLGERGLFLQKPFSPQSLAEKVRELLDDDRSANA